MTKGFSIYFALCIKNRMFYVLNDSKQIISFYIKIISYKKPNVECIVNKEKEKDAEEAL